MHLSTETHQFLKKIGWDKIGYVNRSSRLEKVQVQDCIKRA